MSIQSVAPLRAPLIARVRTSFCSLTLAALLAACAMPTHPDSAAPAADPFNPAATQLLDDTSWELTSWKQADGSARDVPHGDHAEPLTLVFSTASGQRRVNGFSGCNRYMGSYALKNGKLTLGPLAGSRMACTSPGGALDSPYRDALAHIAKTGVQMRPPQQLLLVTEDGAALTFARRGQ